MASISRKNRQLEHRFCRWRAPYDEYLTDLEQHGLKDIEKKRFFGFFKFAPELLQFCANFTLMDHSFREGLHNIIFKHECHFLLLTVHQGKFAQDVLT